MEKLRIAYFPDTTNIKAIRRQNIALESDLVISDSIIKLFTLQANSNNGDNQHYNTFLFRFRINRVCENREQFGIFSNVSLLFVDFL